ncbi:MAG: 5-formyltetrahydrofolate cyclo-ligase [Planctomycetota bacterium]|nr:5-formyltetrahydrofolate cyclo-ligase [Planctomycetota bacterium]MDA1213022.1 5-formyltetrahydrofolate cyclo-ligase [Planctomycetota bacterium]
MDETIDLRLAKRNLRAELRRVPRDRDTIAERSERIFERVTELPEWQNAGSVLWYVDLPGEVRTQPFLSKALASPRRCGVTWCEPDELKLVWLESMNELSARTLGILEPVGEIRRDPRRRLDIDEIDLVLVPGMAFDRQGHRLGHGKGYYDRLLSRATDDTTLVALAFDEQVFDDIPHESHDVIMDYVVTESAVFRGSR